MPMATKEEQREYQRQWVAQRRQDWIDSQGGKCSCGSTDRLEVDHIDPKLKTMDPRNIWSRKQETRDKELSNCQVLCYDCHLEKTSKETTIYTSHGTLGFYYKGCRCFECRQAHNKYNQEWRAKQKSSTNN